MCVNIFALNFGTSLKIQKEDQVQEITEPRAFSFHPNDFVWKRTCNSQNFPKFDGHKSFGCLTQSLRKTLKTQKALDVWHKA